LGRLLGLGQVRKDYSLNTVGRNFPRVLVFRDWSFKNVFLNSTFKQMAVLDNLEGGNPFHWDYWPPKEASYKIKVIRGDLVATTKGLNEL